MESRPSETENIKIIIKTEEKDEKANEIDNSEMTEEDKEEKPDRYTEEEWEEVLTRRRDRRIREREEYRKLETRLPAGSYKTVITQVKNPIELKLDSKKEELTS